MPLCGLATPSGTRMSRSGSVKYGRSTGPNTPPVSSAFPVTHIGSRISTTTAMRESGISARCAIHSSRNATVRYSRKDIGGGVYVECPVVNCERRRSIESPQSPCGVWKANVECSV